MKVRVKRNPCRALGSRATSVKFNGNVLWLVAQRFVSIIIYHEHPAQRRVLFPSEPVPQIALAAGGKPPAGWGNEQVQPVPVAQLVRLSPGFRGANARLVEFRHCGCASCGVLDVPAYVPAAVFRYQRNGSDVMR
jgi:hypothetical protein